MTETTSSAYDGDSRIQQFQRGQGKGGERLVQGKVGLQMDCQADAPAVGALLCRRDALYHLGGEELAVNRERLLHQPQLRRPRFMVLGEQAPGSSEGITGPFHQVHQHRVGDSEA